MPSKVSRTQMARRRELTAQFLRMLLSERATYRSQWARQVGKSSPGDVSQAAVAKVIVNHLQRTGDAAIRQDYRLLKDRVNRALSGRALTPVTLELFISAFLFSKDDARNLWALFLGTTPDEARAAAHPPGFHVARLCETHVVNSEGRPLTHRVWQKITAVNDGMSRFPLRFDSVPSKIEVSTGEVSAIYRCADELFGADVLLPRMLMSDESFDIEYAIEFAADAKADPEFLRGARGRCIDSATIVVKFDPQRPPAAVWWLVRSDFGGRGRIVCREQVEIDRGSFSVSKTVMSVDDVVIGFRWEW